MIEKKNSRVEGESQLGTLKVSESWLMIYCNEHLSIHFSCREMDFLKIHFFSFLQLSLKICNEGRRVKRAPSIAVVRAVNGRIRKFFHHGCPYFFQRFGGK